MSPDYTANKSSKPDDSEPIRRRGAAREAAREMTKRARVVPDGPEFNDEAAAEAEIGFMFRQKLAGLRRLPKRERIHALRAAKVWRSQALKALKEKRATARQFHHAQRRPARMPEPT